MNSSIQTRTVFKPRVLPRSLVDILVGLLMTPWYLVVLLLLPGLLAYAIFRSELSVLLAFWTIYGAIIGFSVWSIALSPEGIHFRRFLGSPKFLAWSDVVSIELAPRSELIRWGWIWPLFPSREMTPCLSFEQHYRIRWAGGFCYFPPADTVAFEHHVSKYLTTLVD